MMEARNIAQLPASTALAMAPAVVVLTPRVPTSYIALNDAARMVIRVAATRSSVANWFFTLELVVILRFLPRDENG